MVWTSDRLCYLSRVLHLPVQVGLRTQGTAGVRRAVHQPDIVFASRAVSPQDVGPAIAVEIAHAGHLPVQVGLRQVTLAGDRGAVHQVDIVFASGAVSPQDVGLAIAVEIAHAGLLPVLVGLRTYGRLAGARGAVH